MNYSLVVNSQFRPYELNELLPIYQANQQAQQQAEDAFTQLSVQAGQWEKLANSAKDKATYNRYKSYANELNSKIDDLMQNGININNRKSLMDLRAKYASQILPIEEAYNKREQQTSELWKMYAQDPTLIMEYNPNDRSLEDYINNPSLRPHLYSGKLLTAQVANQAQALANQLRSYAKTGNISKYYDVITQKYGLSPQDVNDFINGKVNNSILATILKNTLESSGISNWANKDVLKQAEGFLNQGIYSGIGKEAANTLENPEAKAALDYYYKNKLLQDQLAMQGQQNSIDYPAVSPQDIIVPEEQNEANKMYDKFKKYFYNKNGRTYLTEIGREEYHKKTTTNEPVKYDEKTGKWYFVRSTIVHGSMQGSTQEKQYVPKGTKIEYDKNNNPIVKTNTGQSEFRSFLDSIGASKYLNLGKDKRGWQPGNVGNVWNKYISTGVKGDAKKYTEYDFSLDDNAQKAIKQKVGDSAMNEGKINIVKFDRKQGKWVTSKQINVQDFLNEDNKYKVTTMRASSTGNTLIINDKDGNQYRILMPASINPVAQSNMKKALEDNTDASIMVHTGKYPNNQSKYGLKAGKPLTETEVQIANKIYANTLSSIYSFLSQLGIRNQLQPQKWSAVGQSNNSLNNFYNSQSDNSEQ